MAPELDGNPEICVYVRQGLLRRWKPAPPPVYDAPVRQKMEDLWILGPRVAGLRKAEELLGTPEYLRQLPAIHGEAHERWERW